MAKRQSDPSRPECGCDARIAGYLACGQGWPRRAPSWLPAHDRAYQARWLSGYDERAGRDIYGFVHPHSYLVIDPDHR